MSWVGIGGAFQPIVLESFLVTTSLTLLRRLRADEAAPAAGSTARRLEE